MPIAQGSGLHEPLTQYSGYSQVTLRHGSGGKLDETAPTRTAKTRVFLKKVTIIFRCVYNSVQSIPKLVSNFLR